jgi:hypothetical protein
MKINFIFTAILFAFTATVGHAQSYSIDWHKIAAGGGTSTGGVYQVSGTIGQHDAGTAMTGGNFSLTGGYWSLFAVQTPGAPFLTITRSGNNAIISWSSPSTGFTLQTNSNLANASRWGNYLGLVGDDGTTKTATNSPPAGNLFFRLIK